MRSTRRIRDLIIEIVIAVILVTGLVAYFFTMPPGSQINWHRIWLVANTAIVFGFIFWWYRHSWKSITFWGIFLTLLFVHLAIYTFVLARVREWPLIFYAALNPVEWMIMIPVFSAITSKKISRM